MRPLPRLLRPALFSSLALGLVAAACSSKETSSTTSSSTTATSTSSGGGSTATAGSGGAGGSGFEPCTAATITEVCGPSSACAPVTCEMGTCKKALAPKGAACSEMGGTVCDGEGLCVAAHCEDGKVDDDETDIDCGGACPACEDGKACKVAKDCITGRCAKGATDALSCQPCAAHADCDADRYCDPATKRCELDRKNGEACSDGNECPGNYCVDGVCCDSACTETCATCNADFGATKSGACTPNGLTNQIDPGHCDDEGNGKCGGAYCGCDATGKCVKTAGGLGEACGKDSECKSGFCADGVCCDTACKGLCQACSLDAGAAKDGTCGPVTKLVQDPGNCDDTNGSCGGKCACSATAQCKKANGEKCGFGGGSCASGKCQHIYQQWVNCY